MRAQLAGKIAHLSEITQAAFVDPLKDLPRVEPWMAQLRQYTLEFVQVGFGDVDSTRGRHGSRREYVGRRKGQILIVLCRPSPAVRGERLEGRVSRVLA